MQTSTFAPVLVLTAALAAAPALAGDDSPGSPKREATIGVIAGGILGAIFGGPPGAIAGAAIGGYAGDRTGVARRVEPLSEELRGVARERDALLSQRTSLDAEVASLRASLELQRELADQARDAATLADGLEFAIVFRTGASEPPEEATRGLQALAVLLEETPELVVQLDGYADPRGGKDYNAELSTARAEAVRAGLVAAGVDPGRIFAAGHGELGSAAGDPEAWAMERRVSVRLKLADDRLAARP